MECSKCGSEMILRPGKFGEFYGCSTFPVCRNTVSANGSPSSFKRRTEAPKKELKKIENPTPEQQAAFDALDSIIKTGLYRSKRNFVINATAGSGKTALLEHMIYMLMNAKPFINVIYLVFDKQSQLEAKSKGLPARTINSKTFQDYRIWLTRKQREEELPEKLDVDNDKVYGLIIDRMKELFPDKEEFAEYKYLIGSLKKVVNHFKTYGIVDPKAEYVEEVLFSIALMVLPKHVSIACEIAIEVLRRNNIMLDVIDFSDQVYFPYIFNIPLQTYNYIFVDEMQDLSDMMGELLLRMIDEDSYVVGVGDDDQSIYAFRGASIDSIKKLVEMTDSNVLSLTTTFRCPQEAGRLMNEVHPDIAFNIFENNIVGEIREVHEDTYLDQLPDGAIVICRTNAPLIDPVMQLIKMGIKAYIFGRSIGTELASVISKYEYSTDSNNTPIDYLLKSLSKDFYDKVDKLVDEGKDIQAANLLDKLDTLRVLCSECETSGDVKKKIEMIFSDEKDGIGFTTIHRIKGNEADDVYLLNSENVPHPAAKSDDELAQERNMDFVRLSRFKKTITWIANSDPKSRCPVLTTEEYERAMIDKQETEEDAEASIHEEEITIN